MKVMDQFKLDLYEDEVFVFTPKGDLYKMAKGATVLDFAFHIHSQLGSKCVGGKINGKIVPLRQTLNSGDQVEITTSSTQTPKQNWLNIATTTKARTKIRQALKELNTTQCDLAKEMLERKFKNRKIEYDESVMMHLIKRIGYKNVTDFYQHIADEVLDVNDILEKYIEQQKHDNREDAIPNAPGVEGFNLQTPTDEIVEQEDVLLIDKHLTGVDFKLAKCCNPIYGDEVFGFVTVTNGIKIHRKNCSNANQMRERFGYRIVKAEWTGKSHETKYTVMLHVVGNNDIGIVTNITSVIAKETDVSLRSINIESNDGLFACTLTVMVNDTSRMEILIKKLTTIRGVKQVNRY
jgi:GTP pyrophosphokinase